MTIDVDTVLRVQTGTVLAQGVRAKLRTALSSAKRGQWAAAERAFSYVIEQVPLHWEAYVGRGNMYQVRGDFERAIRDFTHAIRIAPDHAAPLWGRANARYLAGDLAGAIHDFDAVIARQNDAARAYERRGVVLQRLGREEAAEADFTRAIELGDGDRSVAYAHRAAVRALRGLSAMPRSIAKWPWGSCPSAAGSTKPPYASIARSWRRRSRETRAQAQEREAQVGTGQECARVEDEDGARVEDGQGKSEQARREEGYIPAKISMSGGHVIMSSCAAPRVV